MLSNGSKRHFNSSANNEVEVRPQILIFRFELLFTGVSRKCMNVHGFAYEQDKVT